MSLLGNLTIGILGNMNGLSNTIKGAKSEIQKFANSAQALGGSISSVGDTLTRKITMPAVAAASALTGITLVKGFSRLVGIDTAQAKLKGLGHDAKSVENIMTSALDAVRGTAYGLDEAATTAASAVAAGIKPGKELTRYLSLTGDAAAIAGSSMGEMGSIINKVQTAQKAYTGELNQLADRGIPIFQWLGEEAGVSAEDVRKMASDGAISSEMFLKAIENNIGGAAKTMGEESFTAGIANIGAALGRLGANFLDAGGEGKGFFSTVKPLLGEAIGLIDGLAGKAADLGVKFGEAFNNLITKVMEIKDWFTGLSADTQGLIAKIAGIGAVVAIGMGPALKIIGALIANFGILTSVVGFLTGPVGLTVLAVAGLGAALIALWKNSETFRNGVTEIFNKVKDVAVQAFGIIASFVGEKIAQIKQFWDENGAQFLAAVENVFNGILAVINFCMPAVLFVVRMVWTAVKQVIDGALNVIMGLVKVFSGLFTGDFSKMWEGIKQIFKGAIDLVIGWMTLTFVGGIRALLTNLAKLGVNLVKNLSTGILNIFNGLKSTGVNLAKGLVDGVLNLFRNLLLSVRLIFNSIRSTGSSIWTGIKDTIVNIAKIIWDLVASRFTGMVSSIRSIFGTARSTISSIWSNVMSFFREINLTSIGKDIIRGLINGIGSMASAVWEKARSIASGIGNSIKNVLQIASPSKVTTQQGKFVGQGLVKGLSNSAKSVAAAAKKVANEAIKNLEVKFDTKKIGASKYIEELKKIQKNFKLTGDQARKVKKEIYQANQEIKKQAEATKKSVDKINKGIKDANTSYLTKVKSINSKLKDDIKKLQSDFKKQLADLSKSIYNQIGLFDKVESKEVNGKDLLNNLKDQNKKFKQWQDDLAKLQKSGVSQKFIDELRAMGVSSADEINAIANMPKSMLNDYVKAWKEKHQNANKEAETQLEKAKSDMEKQIKKMNEAAKKELDKAKTDWVNKIKKFSEEVKKLGDFKNSGKVLAKNTVAGLINGLGSMKGPLEKEAKKLAKTIEKTIKSTLKIKSPSRLLRDQVGKMIPAGLIDGMESMKQKVVVAAKDLAFATVPKIPTVNIQKGYEAPELTSFYENGHPQELTINVMLPDGRVLASAVVDDVTRIQQRRGKRSRNNPKGGGAFA